MSSAEEPFEHTLAVVADDDGSTVTLRAEGEIDVGTASWLLEVIGQCPRDRRVLLDLAAVEFIDSTGIAVLVRTAGEAAHDHWDFAIGARSTQVDRALDLAGVLPRLPLADQ